MYIEVGSHAWCLDVGSDILSICSLLYSHSNWGAEVGSGRLLEETFFLAFYAEIDISSGGLMLVVTSFLLTYYAYKAVGVLEKKKLYIL